MASFLPVALGLAAWSHTRTASHMSRPAPHPVTPGHSALVQSASRLWMNLNQGDAIPDFDPEQPNQPKQPHANFHSNLAKVSQSLPAWESNTSSKQADEPLFEQLNVQKEFKQTLTLARQLAHTLHSVWGDHDALNLLRLVGQDCVLAAYDHGSLSAMQRCSAAYTFLKADQAVRDKLGDSVEWDAPAVERFRAIKHYPADLSANRHPLVFIRESPVGFPELYVQADHPKYKPELVLQEVARSYQKVAMLAACGVNEIANLLNEPVNQTHLEMVYTLVDAPIHALCDSIQPLDSPQYRVADWQKCRNAYEQCCRLFSEEYMHYLLFGNDSDPHELMVAQNNLAFISPFLKDFLNGRETHWA